MRRLLEDEHNINAEAGDVRGQVDARMVPERMRRRQRLFAEHVEARMRELPALECLQQVRLDQMPAPCDVDQPGTLRQLREQARDRGSPPYRP